MLADNLDFVPSLPRLRKFLAVLTPTRWRCLTRTVLSSVSMVRRAVPGRRGLYRADQRPEGSRRHQPAGPPLGSPASSPPWPPSLCSTWRKRAGMPFRQIKLAAHLALDAELVRESRSRPPALTLRAPCPNSPSHRRMNESPTSRVTCCRSCELSSSLSWTSASSRSPTRSSKRAGRNEPRTGSPLEIAFCHNCALVQGDGIKHSDPEIPSAQGLSYFSSFIPALLIHSRDHAHTLMKSRRPRRRQPGGRGGEQRRLPPEKLRRGRCSGFRRRPGARTCGKRPGGGRSDAERRTSNAATAETLVAEGKKADVILANNVLAHVDGINAFVEEFPAASFSEGRRHRRIRVSRSARHPHPTARAFPHDLPRTRIRPRLVRGPSTSPFKLGHGLHPQTRRGAHRQLHGPPAPADGQQAGGEIDAASKNSRPRRRRSGWAGSIITVPSAPGWRSSANAGALSLIMELTAGGSRVAAYGAAAKGVTLLNYLGFPVRPSPMRSTAMFQQGPRKRDAPRLKPIVRPAQILRLRQAGLRAHSLAWNFGAEIMAAAAGLHGSGQGRLASSPGLSEHCPAPPCGADCVEPVGAEDGRWDLDVRLAA